MFSLSALEQWLGDQVGPLVFLIFAVLLFLLLLYLSAESRRAALIRDRSAKTEDTFAEYLAAYGFDPEIARATYRYLQAVQQVAFPIVPRDDLDRDLGLNQEELDQTVRDLLKQTRRQHLPGLLLSPLITVVDLVRYIQASPRKVAVPHRRIA